MAPVSWYTVAVYRALAFTWSRSAASFTHVSLSILTLALFRGAGAAAGGSPGHFPARVAHAVPTDALARTCLMGSGSAGGAGLLGFSELAPQVLLRLLAPQVLLRLAVP